jgi:coenzyme F420 hydrogenase subunit delta
MLKPVNEYDCLVLGCGNALIGDDGFGPAVIEHLEQHYPIPQNVAAIDCGTSIRDILFDILLSPKKPGKMIIVDVTDSPGLAPGEIREIDIDQIRPEKISDFSLHQFPTTNMLKEIKEETPIEVRVLVVQVSAMPEEVQTGLSEPVQAAIRPMCERIFAEIGSQRQHKGAYHD